MTDEHFRGRIEKELALAQDLSRQGQSGKTRVCARRAAADAIAWYIEKNGLSGWGRDVISILSRLKTDSSYPDEIRKAADRLSSRVTADFSYPSPNDPLEDARNIVEYFRKLVEHGSIL